MTSWNVTAALKLHSIATSRNASTAQWFYYLFPHFTVCNLYDFGFNCTLAKISHMIALQWYWVSYEHMSSVHTYFKCVLLNRLCCCYLRRRRGPFYFSPSKKYHCFLWTMRSKHHDILQVMDKGNLVKLFLTIFHREKKKLQIFLSLILSNWESQKSVYKRDTCVNDVWMAWQ